MTDQTTPEPLTDEDLAAMRAGYAMARGMDARHLRQDTRDAIRLLDEVDRLRAECDRLYTETLRLGISLAETIRERHQLRTQLAAAEQTRIAALAVAADLTEDLAEARAGRVETTTLADPEPHGLAAIRDRVKRDTILTEAEIDGASSGWIELMQARRDRAELLAALDTELGEQTRPGEYVPYAAPCTECRTRRQATTPAGLIGDTDATA